MPEKQPGLGRVPSEPDPRDSAYPLRSLLRRETPTVNYRGWYSDVIWLDQGATSQCTAHAMLHVLHDGPQTHRPYHTAEPLAPVVDLYREAQCLDPWGCRSSDDGSTMRAICQAAQKRGLLGSYWWAQSFEDALDHLLTRGPLLVGTWWYSGMFKPDSTGTIRPTGSRAGGHAWKIDAISRRTQRVRLKNSWGRGWGRRGFAYLSFDDLQRLYEEDGEFVGVSELRVEAAA